jgi:hypothetical protein
VTASAVKTGDKDYEVSFFLPWKSIGVTPVEGMQFGLDVAVDGPTPDGAARKSQLVLFGTANNATDASEFGHAVLGTKQ